MESDLIDRARAGDQAAFAELIEPYRRELQVHAYRMLGSIADAEDTLQESLLAAWRGLERFEARASLRTWLYRIATNRALNMLRSASRRPAEALTLDVEPPEPSRLAEVVWLDPYPDALLDDRAGPANSAISPAPRPATKRARPSRWLSSPPFSCCLLSKGPRSVLRDVLDFSARETAGILNTTEQAVTSALKRARATLKKELPTGRPPTAGSPAEKDLLDRLVRAFEAGDVDGMVSLMTEDAWLRMPPVPLEYQGRQLVGHFFATVAFRNGRRYRLVATRANGQPAFGVYLYESLTPAWRAAGLFVVSLSGEEIAAITRFDNSALEHLGLPRTLDV